MDRRSSIGPDRARQVVRSAAGRWAAAAVVLLASAGLTGSIATSRAASLAGGEAAVGVESGLKLLMVEEAGCGFCLRWMAEVGPGYKLSSEGRQAPLVVRDRTDPEVKRFGRIVYTPTFILLRDGVERGRILGYPGPDFFWSLLGELLRRETERQGLP